MSRFLQLRLLWRRAAAKPGFTVVALATLAVGIGANVAIFTVVNAVVLRPLPIPDSERLVMLRHAAPGLSQLDELPTSDALHFLYAEESRTLDRVAAYRDGQASFTGPDDPQRVQAAFVTASFFEVMRTSPQLGRVFTAEDDRPGAAPVLVLADGLWRTRFGADPGVVGTIVDVDGAGVEVVGVMPPGFSFSRPAAEFWRPLALDRGAAQLGAFGMNGVARIADGATLEQVRAELGTMLSNLAELLPDQPAVPVLTSAGLAPVVDPAREVGSRRYRGDPVDPARARWGSCCSSRAPTSPTSSSCGSEARHGEGRRSARPSARAAGSSSARSSSKASYSGWPGGFAALPLALLAVRLVVGFGPEALPRPGRGLGRRIGAGFRSRGVPSRPACCSGSYRRGGRPRSPRREAPRRAHGGPPRAGNGSGRGGGLVVVQVALALTLLVGSGLAVRSFQKLAAVDPGFDPVDALTFGLSLPQRDYEAPESRLAFHRQVVDRLRALPGVVEAAAGTTVPLGGEATGTGHAVEGRPVNIEQGEGAAGLHVEARFARLVRRDGHRARRGPGVRRPRRRARRPRGRRVADGGAGAVAGRERPRQGHPPGARRRPRAWTGPASSAWSTTSTRSRCTKTRRRWCTTRCPSSPRASACPTPCATWCAPRTPPPSPTRRARRCAGSTRRSPSPTSRRWRRWLRGRARSAPSSWSLLVIAAGLALLLGSIGLYGVVSYLVAQRRREIAIRMAVGAQVTDVRRLVLVDAGWMALLGVVLGAGAAAALTRRLQAVLFETAALDPVVFLTVSALLAAICLLASWVPARRAARIDPMTILRAE